MNMTRRAEQENSIGIEELTRGLNSILYTKLIGKMVRHIERGYSIPCETGTVVEIVGVWDNGLGGSGNSGMYDPPVIVVKLDKQFVTGGNNGFISAPMNMFTLIES